MKKVYIAGPITGVPNYKEHFEAVAEAAKELGLDPVNPAEAPEGLTYREYIDLGIEKLQGCDLICCMTQDPWYRDKRRFLLPESKGERLEWQYAITVGMPVLMAYKAEEFDNKGKYKRGKWIIEVPKCWPGMFGGEEK